MIVRILTATSLLLAGTAAIAAPSKPKPASTVLITNARGVPATRVSVGVEGQSASLAKPLAPNTKATLKLPKVSGCTVAVAATFEDDSTADLPDLDICKDRTIHLTD